MKFGNGTKLRGMASTMAEKMRTKKMIVRNFINDLKEKKNRMQLFGQMCHSVFIWNNDHHMKELLAGQQSCRRVYTCYRRV